MEITDKRYGWTGGGGSTAIHQEYKRDGFNVHTKKKLNIQLVNYIEYSRPKLEMKHIGNPERDTLIAFCFYSCCVMKYPPVSAESVSCRVCVLRHIIKWMMRG
jgi:hypothetical protein